MTELDFVRAGDAVHVAAAFRARRARAQALRAAAAAVLRWAARRAVAIGRPRGRALAARC